MILQKGDYCLRPIIEDDLDQLLLWRNSERVRAFMYSDHTISIQEHLAWYERAVRAEFPTVLIFVYGGQPIGMKCFTQIDRKNNRCHWGFYLGETEIPKGSGSIMGFMAQEYIFLEKNFHKLCAEAFVFNEASQRYHKRLGFREEGRFVQHIWKNGRYEDIICYAILRDEWMEFRDDIAKKIFASMEL